MSSRVRLERSARVPDPLRVARYRRAPELGPRILFFSGGSALRKPCRKLKRYTHNSVHLVTPFDSGGSSAQLRHAFGMLSVGDLRNRLLSLADETVRGNPEIYALFSHRMDADGAPQRLSADLDSMVLGDHPLVAQVPQPLRQIVRTHLRHFAQRMPLDFDLRRASIGNLILAGGYLANDRDIDSVAFLFSKLVEVRGVVRPVVEADLHLCAELEDGRRLVGQHRLTGKQELPIDSAVRELYLADSLDRARPVTVDAPEKTRALVRDAELICFPMGSFYSSVIANLLPRGVGRAVVAAECPKLYVPNMGADPEQLHLPIDRAVRRLIDVIRRDAGEDTPVERILNLVVVDTERGHYASPVDTARIKELGVEVLDLRLVGEGEWPWIDADLLSEVLLSLA